MDFIFNFTLTIGEMVSFIKAWSPKLYGFSKRKQYFDTKANLFFDKVSEQCAFNTSWFVLKKTMNN